MSAADIVFEEPPSGAHGRAVSSVHEQIAAQLKARPGEWAKVRTAATQATANGLARRIKGGLVAAYRPAGAFEAMARCVDGEHRCYARYVGEGR